MRAIRTMRAPGATAVVTGAFVILLGVAILMISGGSAAAAAAHRTRGDLRRMPPARRHVRGRHHHRRHRHVIKRAVEMIPAVASWYYDEGDTACGFHAEYGVANKTLPCGTKVTLSYNGHTVVATVDDRGPFVYGRSFDLDQRTAGALGMWGVATVLCSRV